MSDTLIFLPDGEIRGWVIECHGDLDANESYYIHYSWNGRPVRKWFTEHGYAFVVPFLDHPSPESASRVMYAHERMAPSFAGMKPLLTAQCYGSYTAFDVLEASPGVFAGCAMLHPMSSLYVDADHDFGRITDPVKIWHGDADVTAPCGYSMRLPFPSVIVAGGSHLQLTVDRYLADMGEFIESLGGTA